MNNPFAKFAKKITPEIKVETEKEIIDIPAEEKPTEKDVKAEIEAEKVEDIVENESENESEEPDQTEQKTVEKHTRKTRKTKKAEAKPGLGEEKQAPDETPRAVEQVPMIDTKQAFKDYTTMKERLLFDNVDPKFDEFREDIKKRLDDLNITPDLNEGSAKIILPIIDQLYARLRPYKCEIEALASAIADTKANQKSINSVGSSDKTREREGNLACMSFVIDKKNSSINLFGVEALIRSRVGWVNSVLDILEHKRWTVLNMLKIMEREE